MFIKKIQAIWSHQPLTNCSVKLFDISKLILGSPTQGKIYVACLDWACWSFEMNPFNYFLQLLCQKAKNPLKIFESKFPQKNKSHWGSLLRIYHNGKRGFWGDWLTFDLIAMISTPSPFIVLFFPQISTFIVQIGFLSLNAHSVLCNVFSHLKFDSSIEWTYHFET